MVKKLLLVTSLCLFSLFLFAQNLNLSDETPQEKELRMQWWTDARFGMFIHWGTYSLPARHEWVKMRERISNASYQKYFDEFDPAHFEPEKWAKEAKAAGMKYAVLTTKHHEGFCLFDSKYTDYKAPYTKAHRDLVREFVNAFRKEGLKIGFYYSLIDWHHPDFTVDLNSPFRPAGIERNAKLTKQDSLAFQKLNAGKNFTRYREYLFNQVRELLTNYGKIDIMWFDFSYPQAPLGKGHNDWGSKDLLSMVRKLQPGIIVNNRLDLNNYSDGYDFVTPEQVKSDALAKLRGEAFETCQTFSGSWGYFRDETTWKSQRQLLDLLISSVSNGGNLLLNVGPTARGEFDYRAVKALDSLSYWMHANDKAIYNCTFAPEGFKVPSGTKLTYNPKTNRLYAFLYEYPENGEIVLPGYANKVKYTQFLNDDSELLLSKDSKNASNMILKVPKMKPPYEIPVVEVMLK